MRKRTHASRYRIWFQANPSAMPRSHPMELPSLSRETDRLLLCLLRAVGQSSSQAPSAVRRALAGRPTANALPSQARAASGRSLPTVDHRDALLVGLPVQAILALQQTVVRAGRPTAGGYSLKAAVAGGAVCWSSVRTAMSPAFSLSPE